MSAFAAVDLGASSGRVMVGDFSRAIELTEVHRFPNRPVRAGGTLYWDILALYQGVWTACARRAGWTRSASILGASIMDCSTPTVHCWATPCTTAVLTPASREANFTNEVGVDGTIRYLRNVTGLWLLQECQRVWDIPDTQRLLAEAATLPRGAVVDVNDPRFLPPGDMPSRIATACAETDQPLPSVV